MDIEQVVMRQQPSESETIKSPALEALCHDLDMFINELSLNSNYKTSSNQLDSYSLSVSIFSIKTKDTPFFCLSLLCRMNT